MLSTGSHNPRAREMAWFGQGLQMVACGGECIEEKNPRAKQAEWKREDK